MTVPYSFGAATSAIPLSQLDANFNTPITLGNTAIQLGNTVTTLNNMTLANVTISSGNVTITNVTVTTANVTTVNTTTLIATTANVTTGNVTNLISGNVALTGGSITGTPISGSTGSFTTLTTSSTVTLNGGTAGGVAYLNASKVLTTGSALTFDGTSLGIGASPTFYQGSGLLISRSGYATIRLNDSSSGGTAAEIKQSDSTGLILESISNRPIQFNVNASEQMRLTSTGLGIGTSSLYAKFTSKGTGGGATSTYKGIINAYNLDVDVGLSIGGYNTSPYAMYIQALDPRNGFSTTYPLSLNPDGGNVGIGTSSPGYKLDVFAGTTNSAVAQFTGNNASRGLKISTAQTTFADDTVVLNAQMATYGTLQLATGGTTRATLDASGNLGLGVTPSAWSAGGQINLKDDASISAIGANVNIGANYYYNGGWKFAASGYATQYYQTGGTHRWYTSTASGTATNAITFTQAMTLDASGNLGVGTTSLDYRFTVQGGTGTGIAYRDGTVTNYLGTTGSNLGYLGTLTNHPIAFLTNATERARIDTSGDFGLGTSAGTGTRTLTIQTNTSGDPTLSLTAAGADLGSLWFERSTLRLYARASNTGGVYLASGGTSWTAVSDERKKDIIESITDAVSKVSTLRAVIGKYKDDSKQKRRSFLIAQDVQEVLPEAVDASNPDELGLSYSDTIPLLVAAIKELNAKVQSLEAQLKGK